MAQSHRAPAGKTRATFGIKSQFSAKKILRCILTCLEMKVYIPGRDISEMPEECRKDGNAWFFAWDLTSPEAPAASVGCVAAAALAAVTCCADQTPKLPVINNKLIRSVVLGALDWPGAPGVYCNFNTSHLSSSMIRDIRWDRKRKDYYDSLE